jgi:site-specific DNA-methyltransferase (adenine-specific)
MESKKEPNTFFRSKDGSIKIFNESFLTTKNIHDESIDMIVTSPPYNLEIDYVSTKDDLTYTAYLEFTKKWLQTALSVLKSDGRMCLNVPLDKNKGGQQSIAADITTLAKEVGWRYHSTIIWNEGNISKRTAWGSWLSASAPYVIAPVEVVVLLYKNQWKKSEKKQSDITKEEFIEWTNGLWTFSGESKKRVNHPTPFPIELPKRCIKLFSYLEDTILDPFLGSGTTLVACALQKRKGIGVEIESKYCAIAQDRLKKEAQKH